MKSVDNLKDRILKKILKAPRSHAVFNHMPINNEDDRDAFGYIYDRIFSWHKQSRGDS